MPTGPARPAWWWPRWPRRSRSSSGTTTARRDDGTWEYDLTDASTDTLRDIVTDPRIADTSGFDRTRLRVFQFAPDPNTNAWFYYLTLAMSPLALIAWLRGREHDPTNRIPVLATIVMAVWMQGFLMRSASESAVSDVSAISAVLGAWLVARGLTRAPGAWWRGAPKMTARWIS